MISFSTLALAGGGFNPLDPAGLGGLFWTVLIFALSIVPIWMFVLGPITRTLLERDDQATRAIEIAKKASADAEAARAEVEVKLGEARSEAAKLLAEARERAEEREREIVAAAKTEASNLLESAREAIRAEQDKALSTIRKEVVELTFRTSEEVLRRSVESDDNKRLVEELVSATEASA